MEFSDAFPKRCAWLLNVPFFWTLHSTSVLCGSRGVDSSHEKCPVAFLEGIRGGWSVSLCQPVLRNLGITWGCAGAGGLWSSSSLSFSMSRCTLLHFLPDSNKFSKVSGPSHPSLSKLRVKKGFSGLGVGHLKDPHRAVTPQYPWAGGLKLILPD